jgi:hypothetical protein
VAVANHALGRFGATTVNRITYDGGRCLPENLTKGNEINCDKVVVIRWKVLVRPEADGDLLTCEPAKVLPMAQRYFLF